MATFSPQLPNQGDPEYLRYSKPISGVEGNKSSQYLMKGLGEALDQGVDAADKLASKYTKDTAYAEGQKIEDEHKAQLEPLWKQLTAGENPDANSDVSQPSQFLGDSEPGSLANNKELPPEIKYGTKQAASLNEHFVNGKFSQTHYDMEIDSLAKDLHSRFPGYRTEIDAGLSKATGRANASRTVSDMIADINRITSAANSEKNKVLTQIDQAGKYMPPDLYMKLRDAHQSGRISDTKALGMAKSYEHFDVNQNRIKTQNELDIQERGNQEHAATQNFNEATAGIATRFMTDVSVSNDGKSWEELTKMAQKLRDNPNDPEALKVTNDMRTLAESMERDMYKLSNQPGYARTIGGKTKQLIDERMSHFRTLINDLGDPQKAGSAMSATRQFIETLSSQAQIGIAKSDIGRQVIMYGAFGKLSPEIQHEYLDTFQQVNKDAGPKIRQLFEDFARSATGVKPEDSKNKPASVSKAIEDARLRGADPKTLQSYIDFSKNIAKLGDEEARNMAYAYFSPDNIGLIGKWANDSYDYRSGKEAQGKVAIFQKLGSKSITDRIYSLNDPQLIKYHQDFMEQAFTRHVFPGLLHDMEGVAKFNLAYDTNTQHFVVKPGDERGVIAYTRGTTTYGAAEQTIKKLNYSIDAVKEIAKHQGQDPNTYLIKLIMTDNPALFSREIPGAPGEINRAIQNQLLAKKMKSNPNKGTE
jgi:hypothetical protein